MIIIDDAKYKTLLHTSSRYRLTPGDAHKEDVYEFLASNLTDSFTHFVKESYGVCLTNEQVKVEDKGELLIAHFEPNKRHIALWGDIDKIIEIPLNFGAPFAVQVKLQEPKKGVWGGAEYTVPYDVLQYWPWGYDLERNVQVWKVI